MYTYILIPFCSMGFQPLLTGTGHSKCFTWCGRMRSWTRSVPHWKYMLISAKYKPVLINRKVILKTTCNVLYAAFVSRGAGSESEAAEEQE